MATNSFDDRIDGINSLEERCLVDEGEAILNKKAVYEPTKGQRFRQVVCTKTWAFCILVSMAFVIIAVAAMAAFARPGLMSSPACDVGEGASNSSQTGAATKKLSFVATNGEPFPWHDIRLPNTITPESYDLFLHPNISASFFQGKVTITSHVEERTDFIVFNILELNITALQVFKTTADSTGKNIKEEISVAKHLEFVAHQQLYIKLDQMLEKGSSIDIHVGFLGSLASLDKMSGFYKSAYTVNGERRLMASTQFEASSARNAFPCFDEPALKATFKLSIVRDPQHITLFNTPLKNTTPFSNGLLVDNYERTVRMSTYLLAYVVCDFKNITTKTREGVTVRVFAPEDKIYMGKYALDAAVTVIEFYNKFFKISYPLSKQDLIAIPNFAAGAMENWGLITYRDTAILYDPKISTERTKQWVATVVAHELAHQWFGNLVTMEWWNDIWLNEGFASYMSYIGADEVDQNFHMFGNYILSFTDALFLDSLTSSHPIEVKVKDPAEVEGAFDAISYDKGACLIHMLKNMIGDAKFQQGLSYYLHEHSYGNAETKDLWDAFGKVSEMPDGLDVSEVMDTWTKQMGYPVVTVIRKDNKLNLSQERFLLNKEANMNMTRSPFGYKWNVPFTYSTSDEPNKINLVWMKMGSAETVIPGTQSLEWVKGNAKAQGFYRVNYDQEGWKAIIRQLKTDHEVFSFEDRASLIDDVFTLAWANIIDYSVALDLSLYLVNEKNYYVWVTAMGHLNSMAKRLYLHETYDDITVLMLHLTAPLIDSLGWDDTGDHSVRKMQTLMITNAIRLEYGPSVEKAKVMFQLWKANQSVEMNNDLRGVIYSAGIRYGSKKDWDLVFQRYQKSNVPSEKIILLGSLAAPRDARILQILLEYGLDNSKIKSQDTSRVIASVAANPVGFLYAWRFIRENWDTIYQRYGHGSFIMTGIIKSVVHGFSEQFDYDEVETFFSDKELGSASLGLEQAKDIIRSHILWEKNNLNEVNNWLQGPGRSFHQGR